MKAIEIFSFPAGSPVNSWVRKGNGVYPLHDTFMFGKNRRILLRIRILMSLYLEIMILTC
ncbi:MAG: hypothetical protein CBC97_02630 [Verrucomicrobiaceae bacterium TMED137]|nr:MAG: hypothetical protein CBC97_02630 [Verrucomicrobiaceae bacterium TMED137]HAE18891.1 hypothetical protein [Verrucomicrobiales bacterium]